MKTLEDLVKYIYNRYPYPKSWWSKAHFEKRCTEIYAAEQAILKCMDSPLREPKDVIFDYILSLEFSIGYIDNPSAVKTINVIINTLSNLYDYFL